MSDPHATVPLPSVTFADGSKAPLLIIPFDRHGAPIAPETRAALLAAAARGAYSSILVFSHGWNTDWQDATRLYQRFYRQLLDVMGEFPSASARQSNPLLVGIFWPSVTLVAPWERAPRMAGQLGEGLSGLVGDIPALLGSDSDRLMALLGNGTGLNQADAAALAGLLKPLYGVSSADEAPLPQLDTDDIVALWRALAALDTPLVFDESGFADPRLAEPQIAGDPGRVLLSPRVALRCTTVWCMKDRAATVGAVGVAPLLADLLAAAPGASLHLVGHSFGGKLMLSALAGVALPRQVDSVLLLQPAVSCYCFADQVPGSALPGGYRPALEQVRQPIWVTFSARDEALARFHLFLRRPSDLGERRIAGATPDPFAALGYVGPHGLAGGLARVAAPRLGVAYPTFEPATRLVAVEAHQAIAAHSDVTNPHTAWMLYQQMQP